MGYIEVTTYLAFVIFTPREMIQFDLRRFFKGVGPGWFNHQLSIFKSFYKKILGYPSMAEFQGERWFVWPVIGM